MRFVIYRLFRIILVITLAIGEVYAQKKSTEGLLRVYVDNDFLNIRGEGTDKAYSGGIRFDFTFEQSRKPLLIPAAANFSQDSMIYANQWGVMQMMFTPNNIDEVLVQPQDYYYSGALFLTHSEYAFNRTRHYSLQTEIQTGVRGPSAFGKETQIWVHRMINYRLPRGWDNQLKNMPIINFNLAFEKQIIAVSSWLELIAGSKLRLGTLENGISVYPLIRIGIMKPYFDGYIGQFSGGGKTGLKKRKIQAYLVIRPVVEWMLTNGMIQERSLSIKQLEKLFSRSNVNNTSNFSDKQTPIRNFVYSVNYGALISTGKFGMSFIQNASTELRKKTYSHEVGNVSFYFIL